MTVSETLKQAWAAVEEAGLPEHIHEVAFREAVRLFSPLPGPEALAAVVPSLPSHRATTAVGAGDGANSNGGGSNGEGTAISAPEDEIRDKVARQTGVEPSELEEVFHLDDGILKVSIPGIKLGKNNAEKTRAIAQIITIVRGFGLDETETSLELIRAEAQRLKCYDPANFSSQVKALNGYLITGSGTNRRIRAKSAGIQGFPAFVESLVNEA